MLPEKNLRGAIRSDQRGTDSDDWSREGAKKGGDRATGSGHLTKRSDLASSRSRQAMPHDILIVDDEALDAERLTATLRVLYGYQVSIRWACSIADALDSLAETQPSLTFLDDILKPSADAFLSIPELRRAGYEGPIIVVSGAVTQSRRTRLIAGGATDVIHKDDVDSVRVAEAVDRARADQPKGRG
ncbi:MAG: response regulator [Hyphomicrobium sp.]